MNSGKNTLFARAFAKVFQPNLNTNYTIELNEPIIANVFMLLWFVRRQSKYRDDKDWYP